MRGETQRFKGYHDEALATFDEARALIERPARTTRSSLGDALRNIGVTHTLGGDLDAAIDELEEARRLLEQVGDLAGIGNTCGTLAQCYSCAASRCRRSARCSARSRRSSARATRSTCGLTLNNTGMVYYELGEYEQALQVYERGCALVRGAGNTMQEAFDPCGHRRDVPRRWAASTRASRRTKRCAR